MAEANNTKNNDRDLEIAEKILQNTLLLRRLSDKVYHLMLEDLRLSRDRNRYF